MTLLHLAGRENFEYRNRTFSIEVSVREIHRIANPKKRRPQLEEAAYLLLDFMRRDAEGLVTDDECNAPEPDDDEEEEEDPEEQSTRETLPQEDETNPY